MVASYLLFSPGPYRRPDCTHALPNCWVAFKVHGAGSTGGFQRRSPTGAAAKGTPFHEYVPVVAESSLPNPVPTAVARWFGGTSTSSPPHPARAAIRKMAAPARLTAPCVAL